MRTRKRLEKEIAADIRHFLEVHGYRAVRIISGPVRNMRGGERYAPQQGNPKGYPDWVYVRSTTGIIKTEKGLRFASPTNFFLETKRPGEKPTKEQQLWLEVLRKDCFLAEWFDGFQAGEGKRPFLPWWRKNVEI